MAQTGRGGVPQNVKVRGGAGLPQESIGTGFSFIFWKQANQQIMETVNVCQLQFHLSNSITGLIILGANYNLTEAIQALVSKGVKPMSSDYLLPSKSHQSLG